MKWSEENVAQSCPTLCHPMDCSLPSSSIHGILQARILEWVTIPFSRGSSQPRDWLRSPALQADSSPSEPPGKPKNRILMLFTQRLKKTGWGTKASPGQDSSIMRSVFLKKQKYIWILSAWNVGYLGLIPGLGRSPREGKGCPLQCSGLEKSMDCTRLQSRTGLGDFHFHEYYKAIRTRKSCHLWQSWINLEGIMLSEITQRERQILYDLTYMWNHGL